MITRKLCPKLATFSTPQLIGNIRTNQSINESSLTYRRIRSWTLSSPRLKHIFPHHGTISIVQITRESDPSVSLNVDQFDDTQKEKQISVDPIDVDEKSISLFYQSTISFMSSTNLNHNVVTIPILINLQRLIGDPYNRDFETMQAEWLSELIGQKWIHDNNKIFVFSPHGNQKRIENNYPKNDITNLYNNVNIKSKIFLDIRYCRIPMRNGYCRKTKGYHPLSYAETLKDFSSCSGIMPCIASFVIIKSSFNWFNRKLSSRVFELEGMIDPDNTIFLDGLESITNKQGMGARTLILCDKNENIIGSARISGRDPQNRILVTQSYISASLSLNYGAEIYEELLSHCAALGNVKDIISVVDSKLLFPVSTTLKDYSLQEKGISYNSVDEKQIQNKVNEDEMIRILPTTNIIGHVLNILLVKNRLEGNRNFRESKKGGVLNNIFSFIKWCFTNHRISRNYIAIQGIIKGMDSEDVNKMKTKIWDFPVEMFPMDTEDDYV